MKLLLLLTALAVLPACFVPVDKLNTHSVRIGNSDGGLLDPVINDIDRMRRLGQAAIMDQDYCWSACTMYLAVAECVGANTDFGFHGASRFAVFPDNRNTLFMADYYPGKLGELFLSTRMSAFDPFGVVRLQGSRISEMTGIPICKGKT